MDDLFKFFEQKEAPLGLCRQLECTTVKSGINSQDLTQADKPITGLPESGNRGTERGERQHVRWWLVGVGKATLCMKCIDMKELLMNAGRHQVTALAWETASRLIPSIIYSPSREKERLE